MARTRDHFSAISHLLGAALSVAGLIVLVVYAAQRSLPWHVVGFSIFGASLILLYTASTTYHFLAPSRARRVLQRIDHSLIYVLIAGTYTPICLTALRGPWGWTLFAITWAFAIIGILIKSLTRVRGWVSTTFYIAMGWLAVIAFVPLKDTLSAAGLGWLFLGGVFYTVGAGFFGLDAVYPSDRWFNLHDLFHLFVLAGSASHFMLMLELL